MAGEASVLPEASFALTEKVCEPTASPLYFFGEVQALKAPPSSLHSKVEFASLEEKANVAVFSLVVPEGPEFMAVSGEVVSCGGGGTFAVKVLEAGVASTLPTPSLALTSKVCGPLERFV